MQLEGSLHTPPQKQGIKPKQHKNHPHSRSHEAWKMKLLLKSLSEEVGVAWAPNRQ